MSDVTGVESSIGHLYQTNRQPAVEENNEMGRDVFLELLTVQMQNQDPLSPQDNTEFVAQLAQFTQVESLAQLSGSFDDFTSAFMSSQALEASSLVGTSVTVPASHTLLPPDGIISGSVTLPASTSELAINVYDTNGSLIDTIPAGEQSQGELVFRWDGQFAEVNGELLDWQSSNEQVPHGEYHFVVTATIDGEASQLDTALSANVNSVTINGDGELTLNLAGIGAYNVNDVVQFN
ncbi:flagellar hook assembly protein FlgD [Marinibactrum halimedae]|uniref:Basal-body rod modification protein FlgD n=1 Tax=Marinibactrum halimedae TaxID=1444977 RepID=A0AA37WLK7_9GAMM|nr:flagellar hook capping FlgD N-terminal domain-containing protein [Marinibactrum halimedae]MCD9458392.1 flagellar biosynthesis protein FlgD [Marinibactrum halimedae]GLS26089.1 basal-body rod modification protein FlgD [Marinibactrum halimedae]